MKSNSSRVTLEIVMGSNVERERERGRVGEGGREGERGGGRERVYFHEQGT